MALTKKQVAQLTKPGRYRDERGLYLQITNTGVRSWVFRYQRQHRERNMGLGPVDAFTLEQARERARLARQQLKDGIDPIDARKTERVKQASMEAAAAARARTFKQCTELYFDQHSVGWKSQKHRNEFLSTLATYVFPTIGSLPVADVTRDLVLRSVQPIWQSKNNTAARVLRRIANVLDFAKVNGWRDGDNPAQWESNLEHVLPAPSAVATVKHHAALPFVQVHEFVSQLHKRRGIAARALEFLILTAARTSEVTKATWSEFDLAARVWTIPAARMKTPKDHRVPLSDRAIEILLGLPREGDFVFIGDTVNKPLGPTAMLQMCKAIGRRDIVVHGFRSAFRDWAAEKTTFANHVVEMALAHAIPSAVESAYRRGDLFAKRAALMTDWANYVSTPQQATATVTPIRARV